MLQLEGMEKRFGGVAALSGGNLSVRAGEVHLLLGENGAGKSTLMKIVAGMQRRDAGRMIWKGRDADFTNPREAADEGVAMVHQESLLAPHLTVAENIFLGRETVWVNRSRVIEDARRLIEDHNFPLQADWRVERLSPAGKQMVEICRAVSRGSSLLIFDEPTSSLSESETKEVFRIVRSLKERGTGVIYITHRLDELRSLGDRVTVLRDGKTVHTGEMADTDTPQLIRHMVGRDVSAIYHRESRPAGRELMRVDLPGAKFVLRAGEVVGLGGLVGAGRTELCRVLFGIDPAPAGTIQIDGKTIDIRSPRDAVKAGIALVTEDRQRTGLALRLAVSRNLILANTAAVSPRGVVSQAREDAVTAEYTAKLRIKVSSGKQLCGRLSGGNQQKVVIGKWLFTGAKVVLFDEPTRGIDVGAKAEVFELMDQLARDGAAVLMVSSELPELLQVPDRILVMSQGRIAGELPRGTTQEEVLRLALEGKKE